MRSMATSLRILAFTACFVLLSNAPLRFSAVGGPTDSPLQVAPQTEYGYTCITESLSGYPNCPSGCTGKDYADWYYSGSGQAGANSVASPCGQAKPGQSCTQPSGVLTPPVYDPACCVPEYGTCSYKGTELICCGDLVCFSLNGQCQPCSPTGGTCSVGTDCCSGNCNPASNTCCQVAGPCTFPTDCCTNLDYMCCDNGQCAMM